MFTTPYKQEIIKGKRVFVFVDASNLWAAQKSKGKLFDYIKLTEYIQSHFSAVELKMFYYTAYPAEGTRSYSLDGKHKFFTFLEKHLKIVVRKKELKRIMSETEGGLVVEEKGNMDVEMTIDVLHFLSKYDTAILFTGDSDFLALVTYLKRAGKKSYIFSSENNISQELRTGSDGYFDVLKLSDDIWGKNLQHREAKK